MSPSRVIRPAAKRTPAGARSLLWTAAAAALPVIVTVLVLVAITLAVLVFTARGFDSLFAVVAVEWLVVNRVPLAADDVALGFLPLLPPLIYVAVLARQTRVVLADIEQPGPREAGAAVAGVTLAGVLLTVLATLVVGSADSDFAVRQASLPEALAWTVAIAVAGAGLGVWLWFRRQLREALPLWVRGGLHLGAAFAAATWAIAAALVVIGLLVAWAPVAELLDIGKSVGGTAALTLISMAYLPNVVAAAATIAVGGEAHLGEASFSVFAVSRGPLPDVPLAAVLPTTNPHWVVQGLLLVTVLAAALLARSVAHWFRTTADAVKATWLGAAVVALLISLTPVVAGGQLGALGMVGTGSLIAAGTALLIFGVIGSATIALSLAGLTRRRERAESELARRRQRAGTAVVTEPESRLEPETGQETEPESETETEPESGQDSETEPDTEIATEPVPDRAAEPEPDVADGSGPVDDGSDGDDGHDQDNDKNNDNDNDNNNNDDDEASDRPSEPVAGAGVEDDLRTEDTDRPHPASDDQAGVERGGPEGGPGDHVGRPRADD